MFTGTYTAIVTPFKNGKIDEAALERLIKNQIKAGVDGVVPVGTTGESPTLDHDEHARVIELAVKFARGRCTVMAGTGSNSTREAIAMTQEAERLGADAALLVAPYYNRPTQEGIYQHYKAISESTKLPLVLYSIPGRCGVEIGVETTKRLAETAKNIVCIKEAGGSVERVNALRAVLPEDFTILSGDDSLTLPFMASGAVGVISVASNIAPREVGDLVRLFENGKIAEARALHLKLYPLFKDLFLESNPTPIKAALSWAGRMAADVRLPLCAMSEGNAAKLRATLESLNLIAR